MPSASPAALCRGRYALPQPGLPAQVRAAACSAAHTHLQLQDQRHGLSPWSIAPGMHRMGPLQGGTSLGRRCQSSFQQ